ncbi:DUF305 domain-containing protein [Sphingomonas koreensis]|uniref:DUF305 domain-containing protein n=1 Tax=Sphingomonas koreensis TaxID=93064 RepID=UPI0008365D7A|nr:DUF305 domain-containing protein [Sphingomonas koreensis]PJI87201.1 protein of unknown function (DUF305) [Sphingomonas koreensis]RSU59585.1 DUF305 domain-containing protein [Sphingomonas koreensis]RSU68738.1 DUF305 domain-containing protein [Sphingomonas koreensis]
MSQDHQAHGGQPQSNHGSHDRPYRMFWINMILGLIVMYIVMFSMIDGWSDFHNNLNMFYMALTMWAPMGLFMLATMRGMFPDRRMNIALYVIFALLTAGSFWATRTQSLIGDRQFIGSMIPHHSGAILMCREARLADPELKALCKTIIEAQREEIQRMEGIRARL